ncbi:hypothetical protein D1227_06535 [Henriciella mobilis]|uniref:hypothetical protein n=1 Tax=Henriciella mobilis TaxID=2305467 RepID=UPI000E66BA64|nr:hypothetical protein [Henriciella mobilis]RIJ15934.1 hypothetical protein D1231_09065 [Henriciella mobilis]RIJ21144.1 hypothetical protein D1227_12605 [Henriciella mobilis]RIJ23156.1 hypothetical protein D1227_06535 [Henriciella mobilis]
MIAMVHDLTQFIIIVVYLFVALSGLDALSALHARAPFRAVKAARILGGYLLALLCLRRYEWPADNGVKHVWFFAAVVSTMGGIAMATLNIEYLIARSGDRLGTLTSLRWLAAHFAAGMAVIGFHAALRSGAINKPEPQE